MASTQRGERELKEKVTQELKTATDPVEIIRLKCLQRGCKGIKEIGTRFRIMDDDKSEKISRAEFSKGINELGCAFDKKQMDEAFNAFDTDQSGEIDYNEFLIKLQEKSYNSKRKAIVQKAFDKVDKDKSGEINIDDLKGVYDVHSHPKFKSGELSEDQILEEFLSTFESPGDSDGKVTREEFFSYYAGISASIDNDAYFVLMMENAWKLNESTRKKAAPGDYKSKDLMDSFGKRTARTNFSRGGTDLNCSLKVSQQKSGVFQRAL